MTIHCFHRKVVYLETYNYAEKPPLLYIIYYLDNRYMITIDSLKIHVQSADCFQVNGRKSFYSGHTVSFLEGVRTKLNRKHREWGDMDKLTV